MASFRILSIKLSSFLKVIKNHMLFLNETPTSFDRVVDRTPRTPNLPTANLHRFRCYHIFQLSHNFRIVPCAKQWPHKERIPLRKKKKWMWWKCNLWPRSAIIISLVDRVLLIGRTNSSIKDQTYLGDLKHLGCLSEVKIVEVAVNLHSTQVYSFVIVIGGARSKM